MLRKLFSARRSAEPARGRIPSGQRVYAIGDIHGRLDLLDMLLDLIAQDRANRPAATETIIFLGDLVDRGSDSAGVVERLRGLQQERSNIRFLMGNHEELFLDAMAGDDKATRLFCRVGGRETLLSYGMTPEEYEAADYPAISDEMIRRVPADHRTFLDAFEAMVVLGDYAFVHAGIRPGVTLADQQGSDLRWIRTPFLDYRDRFEKIIVHGHTISEQVDYQPNRIGIDTGAFQTGKLTALGMEDDSTWLIQT